MYLIDKPSNKCRKIEAKSFSELGFKERDHLQEWFVADPNMLGEDLLIIQKEFDGFSDTKERLDLLALDDDGNLVIIENKLDDSGRDVTWQALKYASYCSSLGKDEIRSIYQSYLDKNGDDQTAESRLSDFYKKDYEELILNRGTSQRIILVAAKFRKEVTSTVLWLMNYNLKIQCFKVTPFQNGEELLLDIEQIIPVKDAEDYIIKIAGKTKEDSDTETQLLARHQLRLAFWAELFKELNSKSDLFKNISATKDNWVGVGAGISGVSYNFVITQGGARIELYIGNKSKEKNEEIYDYLHSHEETIVKSFSKSLEWCRMDKKDASKVMTSVEHNYFDRDSWPILIQSLSEIMIEFHKVFSPYLQRFKDSSKLS